MFVDIRQFEIFMEFITQNGAEKIRTPESSMSPDLMFNWRGYLYWAFKEGQGYRFHTDGNGLKSLYDEWSACLTRLIEIQKKKQEDSDGNQ